MGAGTKSKSSSSEWSLMPVPFEHLVDPEATRLLFQETDRRRGERSFSERQYASILVHYYHVDEH
jgi:hypothetical protein